jgi:hypothetical protein
VRRHRRGRRLLVPPALVVALALATSACGGSSGGGAEVASADGSGGATAENASTEEKVDPEQAGLDFARCMREHGVDMPDPKSGGDGFIMVGPGPAGASASASGSGEVQAGRAPEGFQEANEACRHHLEALIQDGGPPMDAEAQDKALKFARCMREHGIDMPDPDFSGGGAGLRIQIGADGIDPGSQTFQDAQKACGSLFGPDGPVPGRVGAATRGTSS